MGISSPSQWKPPADLYVIWDYKYCKVWIRKSDRVEHMQEYKVHIHNEEQLQKYENMFTMRIQQMYFPTTMYFINHDWKYLCGNAKLGSILIQRIPYRLCQFSNIFYNEAISILYHCFYAYHSLYKYYGLFKIQTTMIGLDRFYKLKVWHHTNFTSPIPQDPYCQSMVQMINSIITSIQRISERPRQGLSFKEYLSAKRTVLFSFELAFVMIKQYAEQYDIKFTSSFDNIEKYLREAEGESLGFGSNLSKRSMQNSQRSHSRSSSNNRSIGKYSFKKNKVVDESRQSRRGDELLSLYYRLSPTSRTSSARSRDSRQSRSQSKLVSPLTKMNIYLQNSISKQQQKKNSIISTDDYGIQIKKNKVAPIFQKHLRAVTKFQEIIRQSNLSRDSSQILPYTHNRAVSDLPRKNQIPNNQYILPYPSYENTKTGAQSTSARSKKSILSDDNFSFSIDEDNRQNIINMLKNK